MPGANAFVSSAAVLQSAVHCRDLVDLLQQKGLRDLVVLDIAVDAEAKALLEEVFAAAGEGHIRVPQLMVGDVLVGGLQEAQDANESGELDALILDAAIEDCSDRLAAIRSDDTGGSQTETELNFKLAGLLAQKGEGRHAIELYQRVAGSPAALLMPPPPVVHAALTPTAAATAPTSGCLASQAHLAIGTIVLEGRDGEFWRPTDSRFTSAMPHLTSALSLAPLDPYIHQRLADAHTQAGHLSSAHHHLTHSAAILNSGPPALLESSLQRGAIERELDALSRHRVGVLCSKLASVEREAPFDVNMDVTKASQAAARDDDGLELSLNVRDSIMKLMTGAAQPAPPCLSWSASLLPGPADNGHDGSEGAAGDSSHLPSAPSAAAAAPITADMAPQRVFLDLYYDRLEVSKRSSQTSKKRTALFCLATLPTLTCQDVIFGPNGFMLSGDHASHVYDLDPDSLQTLQASLLSHLETVQRAAYSGQEQPESRYADQKPMGAATVTEEGVPGASVISTTVAHSLEALISGVSTGAGASISPAAMQALRPLTPPLRVFSKDYAKIKETMQALVLFRYLSPSGIQRSVEAATSYLKEQAAVSLGQTASDEPGGGQQQARALHAAVFDLCVSCDFVREKKKMGVEPSEEEEGGQEEEVHARAVEAGILNDVIVPIISSSYPVAASSGDASPASNLEVASGTQLLACLTLQSLARSPSASVGRALKSSRALYHLTRCISRCASTASAHVQLVAMGAADALFRLELIGLRVEGGGTQGGGVSALNAGAERMRKEAAAAAASEQPDVCALVEVTTACLTPSFAATAFAGAAAAPSSSSSSSSAAAAAGRGVSPPAFQPGSGDVKFLAAAMARHMCQSSPALGRLFHTAGAGEQLAHVLATSASPAAIIGPSLGSNCIAALCSLVWGGNASSRKAVAGALSSCKAWPVIANCLNLNVLHDDNASTEAAPPPPGEASVLLCLGLTCFERSLDVGKHMARTDVLNGLVQRMVAVQGVAQEDDDDVTGAAVESVDLAAILTICNLLLTVADLDAARDRVIETSLVGTFQGLQSGKGGLPRQLLLALGALAAGSDQASLSQLIPFNETGGSQASLPSNLGLPLPIQVQLPEMLPPDNWRQPPPADMLQCLLRALLVVLKHSKLHIEAQASGTLAARVLKATVEGAPTCCIMVDALACVQLMQLPMSSQGQLPALSLWTRAALHVSRCVRGLLARRRIARLRAVRWNAFVSRHTHLLSSLQHRQAQAVWGENAAARLLQNIARGNAARKAVRLKRVALQRASAAVTLQSRRRGAVERRCIRALRWSNLLASAPLVMQRVARRFLARRDMHRRQQVLLERNSALCLQRVFQGSKVRKSLHGARSERDRLKACICITRCFRGWLTRKRLAQLAAAFVPRHTVKLAEGEDQSKRGAQKNEPRRELFKKLPAAAQSPTTGKIANVQHRQKRPTACKAKPITYHKSRSYRAMAASSAYRHTVIGYTHLLSGRSTDQAQSRIMGESVATLRLWAAVVLQSFARCVMAVNEASKRRRSSMLADTAWRQCWQSEQRLCRVMQD